MGKILLTYATSYLNSYISLYGLELGLDFRLGLEKDFNNHHVEKVEEIYTLYDKEMDIVELDIENETQLTTVMEGCDTIIHPMVPDLVEIPEDCSSLIKKCVNESLTIMKVAKKLGIKRIVFTGSITNVYAGSSKKEFNDNDWADIKNIGGVLQRVNFYVSKSVWFLQKDWDNFFDLTVLNIGFLIGPAIARRPSHQSNVFIKNLIMGKTTQNFNTQFPTIDVRDAALTHLKVLEMKKSFNQRLNLIQGVHFMRDISEILKDEFEQYNYEIPTGIIGGLPIKLLSLFDTDKGIKKQLFGYGKSIKISNLRIKRLLKGMKYRALDESLIEMGYDLVDKGIVYDKNKKKKKDVSKSNRFYDSKLYQKSHKATDVKSVLDKLYD